MTVQIYHCIYHYIYFNLIENIGLVIFTQPLVEGDNLVLHLSSAATSTNTLLARVYRHCGASMQ